MPRLERSLRPCNKMELTGIEHSQIQQLSNLEVTPDTKLVVNSDLPDRHPLMVSTNTSHLPVRETRARGRELASDRGVVAVGGTGLPRLVCDFMVVPYGDPWSGLVGGPQADVGAVLVQTLTVVGDRGEFSA